MSETGDSGLLLVPFRSYFLLGYKSSPSPMKPGDAWCYAMF